MNLVSMFSLERMVISGKPRLTIENKSITQAWPYRFRPRIHPDTPGSRSRRPICKPIPDPSLRFENLILNQIIRLL